MTLSAAERAAWQQANQIFADLLEQPEAERAQHLQALSLAPEVRSKVERLLDAHHSQGGMLDRNQPVALPGTDALANRRLGRWQLDHEIGRGGMAVVYRAHAIEGPAGQDAALKILTLGALAARGRERFVQEQKALLRLRHPYIAALYDAGVADDGTPWLAMARVEGAHIDQWCDARRLDARARVHLLLQVCEAVAHAHRNLVIHRDIKPSNVLVDDDGRVRLLDFGIARLVDAGGEVTTTGLRALTPQYAAPEQFEGAAATTAMDVYGIGALAYRLLSGSAPPIAESGTLPPPPSRARDAGAAAQARALHDLGKGARGDLDAIVLKTLAPEPGARYPSVEALAADLKRWLDGLPVQAQPPRLRYRLRKFAVRHRLALAASVLLALTLLGGLGATLWQARIARQQATQARQAEARTASVAAFLVSLFEASSPDVAAKGELTVAQLLDAGTRRARTAFASHPDQGTDLMLALARIHQRLGHVEQAEALLRDSHALTSRHPRQQAVGHLLQARLAYDRSQADAAIAAADQGLRLAAQLPPELTLELHLIRAATLQHTPQSKQAAVEIRTALAGLDQADLPPETEAEARLLLLGTLAGYLWTDGAVPEAKRAAEQAWSVVRESGQGEPTQLALLAENHAGILGELGRFDEAIAMQRHALTLTEAAYPPGHRQRAHRNASLAILLSRQGHLEEAEQRLRASLRDFQALYGQPDSHTAHVYNSLGVLLLLLERPAEALPYLQTAYRLTAANYGEHDRSTLAVRTNIAMARSQRGEFAAAAEELDALLALKRQAMGATHPDVAVHLDKMAEHSLRAGNPAHALALVDQALSLYRADAQRPSSVLIALEHRARALAALGRIGEARATYGEAMRLGRRAGADAGRGWPRMLASRAELLAGQHDPQAPGAIAEALAANRAAFGTTHPAVQRLQALSQRINRVQ